MRYYWAQIISENNLNCDFPLWFKVYSSTVLFQFATHPSTCCSKYHVKYLKSFLPFLFLLVTQLFFTHNQSWTLWGGFNIFFTCDCIDSDIPLHSLKSELKTNLFSPAYWFVISFFSFSTNPSLIMHVFVVCACESGSTVLILLIFKRHSFGQNSILRKPYKSFSIQITPKS